MSVVLMVTACSWLSVLSQTTPQATNVPTIRVETKLVLVDVVAEYSKTELHTRALLTDLKGEDFRVFDNDHEMAIRSVDIGASHSTRPIALWLIVQCDIGRPPEWGSGFLRRKTQHLRPALMQLEKDDAVGVAHWCDDGTAAIDLVPGKDPEAALATIDQILSHPAIRGWSRSGELACQKMVRIMVENTHHSTPERLPILLFLYGDHSATYAGEANHVIEDVLETSGIIFGMNDNGYPFDSQDRLRDGQISYLVHYYAAETGGEFYSTVDPKLFSAALSYIVSQLHLRYTLGFKPPAVDGKMHKLKVELTPEAKKRYTGAQLRFRKEYIAAQSR